MIPNIIFFLLPKPLAGPNPSPRIRSIVSHAGHLSHVHIFLDIWRFEPRNEVDRLFLAGAAFTYTPDIPGGLLVPTMDSIHGLSPSRTDCMTTCILKRSQEFLDMSGPSLW